VLVALVSEVFVESVQKAAEDLGMTPAFVGLSRQIRKYGNVLSC
jgi:Ca2+/H+ antiporter